jgi:CheY-like chemotaxis protein
MCRVLLIDDDGTDLFIGKRLFTTYDPKISIDICHNGQEALDFLKRCESSNQQHPDIIICDINMPVLDGYGFICGYSKHFADYKKHCCILIASSTMDRTEIEAFTSHPLVTAFHHKPIQPHKIMESFRKKKESKNLN